MRDACRETTIATLAAYLNVDPLALDLDHRLLDDWGLDALDVALVAIELEDGLDAKIPRIALEGAGTVADLLSVVHDAVEARAGEARGEDDDLAAGASGLTQRIRRAEQRSRQRRS
ncbi:MAG: hypothetical protein KIS78_23040, partial [Labilithrix sp.]|nr:hypothetical protein [Labilithrix sp.]